MKKIKNLEIRGLLHDLKYDAGLLSSICIGLIFSSYAVYAVCYYSYDVQEQIVDDSMDYSDNTYDEDGKICHIFLPGEHRIERTRHDSWRYEATAPDGYMIESVMVKGGNHKNQIVYVNTVPVIAQGEEQKDGTITFNQFGEVVTKDKTIGSKKR